MAVQERLCSLQLRLSQALTRCIQCALIVFWPRNSKHHASRLSAPGLQAGASGSHAMSSAQTLGQSATWCATVGCPSHGLRYHFQSKCVHEFQTELAPGKARSPRYFRECCSGARNTGASMLCVDSFKYRRRPTNSLKIIQKLSDKGRCTGNYETHKTHPHKLAHGGVMTC